MSEITFNQNVLYLVENAPDVVLTLGEFYNWDTEEATDKIHTPGCPLPTVKSEWFAHGAGEVVRMVPEGRSVCIPCARMVLRRYTP